MWRATEGELCLLNHAAHGHRHPFLLAPGKWLQISDLVHQIVGVNNDPVAELVPGTSEAAAVF